MNRHIAQTAIKSRRARKYQPQRRKNMTVCIAAISSDNHGGEVLIGAADRMVSVGGLLRYSPIQSKIFKPSDDIRDSIVMMVAGNLTLQSEIIQRLRKSIAKRNSGQRLSVRDTLDAYGGAYREVYFKKLESAVFVPQGLTIAKYEEKQKQRELDEAVIQHIIDASVKFEKQFKEDEENLIETIIAGRDDDGWHIYLLRFDAEQCRTDDGFAAIGIGGWHAESQFMFANFSHGWKYTDALFLLYKAKKRAEVAEGISPETDLFTVFPRPPAPDLSPIRPLPPKRMQELDDAYGELQFAINAKEQIINERLNIQYEQFAEKQKADAEARQGVTKASDENEEQRADTRTDAGGV